MRLSLFDAPIQASAFVETDRFKNDRFHTLIAIYIPKRPADAIDAPGGLAIFCYDLYLLQFLLYLYLGEGLDNVAHLDIVEVDKRDTALEVDANLLDIVLVTL